MAETDSQSTEKDRTWETMLAFNLEENIENFKMKIIFDEDEDLEIKSKEKKTATKHKLSKKRKTKNLKSKKKKKKEEGVVKCRWSNKTKGKKQLDTSHGKEANRKFNNDEIVSIYWNNLEELSSVSEADKDDKTKDKDKILPTVNNNKMAAENKGVLPKTNVARSLPIIDDIQMQNDDVTQNNKSPLEEIQEFVSGAVTMHMDANPDVHLNNKVNPLTTVTQSESSNKIARTFPRVKYTSLRDVKKYPGKMHAMKSHMSQKSVPSESSQNNKKSVEGLCLNTINSNKPNLPSNRVEQRYENFQFSDNYLSDFLKCTQIISEKLLKIFPYLNEYIIARDAQPHCKDYFHAQKTALTQIKYRIFCDLYETLLPMYTAFESESFTKHFFDNTIKLAEHQASVTNVHSFNIDNFTLLFGEMLKWIGNRIQKERTNVTFAFKSITPTLKSNLVAQRSTLPWTHLHGQQESTTISENRNQFQFSTGPPGREIKIAYNVNNKHIPQVQTLVPGNNNTRVSAQSAHPVLTSHLNENSQRLPITPRVAPPMHSYQRPGPPPPYHQTNTHATHQPPLQCYNNIPPSLPPLYRQEVQTYQDRDALPSIMIPSQERSSVSRDSGFLSPLCEELPSNFEQMESPGQVTADPEHSTLNSLQITHVTSMNPNARFTPYSQCRMCGTITNLRCLGCYREYYCSNMCQNSDWSDHEKMCHQNS